MRTRLRLPSRNGIFAILMACSAILMVLPTRWTGGLKCARQVLVPFQDGMYVLTAASTAGEDLPPITDEEYRRLLRELEARRNQVASLNLLLRELEAERPTIAMTLRKLIDRAANRESALIPARVIADDSTAWRDTMLLGSGRRRGVREDDWVTSRRALDAGTKDGVRQGMIVLAQEYLIGRIEEVTPYTARLVLLSDLAAKVPVWIGRVDGKRFRVLGAAEALRDGKRWAEPGEEASFFLVGRGRGDMIVGGVHEDYVARKALAVGDLVVSAGTSAELPVAMVIGRVEEIEDDPAQRQLRQLNVRCPIDTARLRWVYVVSAPPSPGLPAQ